MTLFNIYLSERPTTYLMVTHFSDDCISPKPQSWTKEMVQLTEQNNNSQEPVSFIKHLETLETIIGDILQPKDPPKKIMRMDNGYRNR